MMSKASDRAYAAIRAMIARGELPPGTQLTEAELATACGVSRTPVREALRRLEAEQYVQRSDGARTFVADWSVDDIDEMFALRGMLEGHAAARASARISADALAELTACNARLGAAVATGDVTAFLAENRAFHAGIIAAASSTRLAGMLGRLVEQPIVQRTAQRYDRAQLQRSHAEHDELLAAFARRDAEWARAVMTGHIRRAFHAYAEARAS
jgi:DNA-binding GntR family transcriptional regulator